MVRKLRLTRINFKLGANRHLPTDTDSGVEAVPQKALVGLDGSPLPDCLPT
jgi:hypothetical protein